MANDSAWKGLVSPSASIITDNNFGLVILTAKGFTHRVVTWSDSYSASAAWDNIPSLVGGDRWIGLPPEG